MKTRSPAGALIVGLLCFGLLVRCGGEQGGDDGQDGSVPGPEAGVDAAIDAAPIECDPPVLPRLKPTHTGWRNPQCWSCHDPSETQYPNAWLYQCANCHETNGAPWARYNHIYQDRCQDCHVLPANHGTTADFRDPFGCRGCHRSMNTETHTGWRRANCQVSGCHGALGYNSYDCARCHTYNGAPERPDLHTAETPCANCHQTSAHHGTNPTDFSDPFSCTVCHPPACRLTPLQ
jgi:hypothetical protein